MIIRQIKLSMDVLRQGLYGRRVYLLARISALLAFHVRYHICEGRFGP